MPQNRDGLCYKVWRIVDSKPFEIAIMVLIAMNAVVLMLSVSIVFFFLNLAICKDAHNRFLHNSQDL